MKFFHISDLHIGKLLHGYSLQENQRAVLKDILEAAKEYEPDGILVAGDIFDKSIPSAEAYTVFDEFLNALSDLPRQIPVCIIAGNHDSARRLSYASSFLEKHGIHIAALPPSEQEDHLQSVVFHDAYGEVTVWLLPFLKPGYVRHLFEEGVVTDYETAVRCVLEREHIDFSKRNVLVAHQFFRGGDAQPEVCDSEQLALSIGGLDQIDVQVVSDFDYVALGHLHGAQQVKYPHIRYCGTPLKYSVSEERHKKAITMVELKEKGAPAAITSIPLQAKQDVKKIRGTMEEVLDLAKKEPGGRCDDFVSIVLTDEEEVWQPKEKLEACYGYLLDIQIDNTRTRRKLQESEWKEEKPLHPLEAFGQFFEDMQGRALSEKEEKVLHRMMSKLDLAEESFEGRGEER